MTWLGFWSSVIRSVAWPTVALVIVIIFRKPLGRLIGRVKKVRAFGGDVDFGEGLEQVEVLSTSIADEAVATGRIVADDPGDSESDLEESSLERRDRRALSEESRTNPAYLILSSWEDLSSAVIHSATEVNAGRASPGTLPTSVNLVSCADYLVDLGVVSRDFKTALFKLRDLRNQVAHGAHLPDSGEALAYAESAKDLRTTLTSLLYSSNDLDDLVARWVRFAPQNEQALTAILDGLRNLGYLLRVSAPRSAGGSPKTYIRALTSAGKNLGYLHSTSFSFVGAKENSLLVTKGSTLGIGTEGRYPRILLSTPGAADFVLQVASDFI